MLKKILTIGLVLSSCASGIFKKTEPSKLVPRYTKYTAAEYIGKNRYEILSSGRMESDELRFYLYERAYHTCKEKGKGFDIVEKLVLVPDNRRDHTSHEAYRIVITCDGEIDEELTRKYANPEMVDN